MAITDTRPESDTAAASPTPVTPARVPALGSGDHKTIGRLYVAAALLFGIAGWVVTALAGIHTIGKQGFLSASAANTLYSSGRLGLILLVVVPLLLGLATYLVPLQVGASTVAFPRLAAGALWTWLLGSGVFIVANAIDGGIGGGRTKAADMGLLALLALIVGLLFGTVCVITTAITMRTPGLRLDRAPAFTWATVVGGSMWLLTLPVLMANIVLVYIDHHYGRPSDFGVPAGQWAQLSWVVAQPQIFAFATPVLGLVTDVVATFSGVRQRNRGVMLGAIGAFGVLSFGAFAQPYFYPRVTDEAMWAIMSLLIVLPMLVLFGGWAATLKSGHPRVKSPVVLSLVAGLLLLLATVAAFLYVITPLQLRVTGYFSAGTFALVISAALAGGLAGLMFWGPKITGHFLNEGLGKLLGLLALVGGLLAGVPLLILGFSIKFSGIASGADFLNGLAVAGDIVMAVTVLLGALALLSGLRGEQAADDAWGIGQSLEWACSCPPPTGNFGELPVVRSPEPLLDAAETSEEA